MSSILKALKKLEEEKSCRTDGGVDIVRGVVRNRPTCYNQRWILPVSVATGAVAASLLTYFLTTGVLSQYSEINPRSSRVEVASGTAVNTDTTAPEPRVATPATVRNRDVSTKDLPRTRRSTGPVVHVSRRTSTSEVTREPTRGQMTPSAQQELLATVPPTPPLSPRLRVSGIAWHKDGNDRVAVVNGVAVTEGMTVEGARVEEISKDKVRFSFEKQVVEVSVGEQ